MHTASLVRALSWTDETGLSELSGWEYGTRTREMADALGGDELRRLSRLAVAGGMLPEGTDLATLTASFTAASAGATYSPLDKRVLLVGDQSKETTANGDSLLTHEFVHALQDQHFDLLKLLLVRPYNFDRTEAVFSVVEGDAMNVQRRAEQGEATYARRTLDDVARLEDARFGEYRQEIGAFFPPLLTETFIFRYRDGARFVEAVRRKGGEQAVNELFARPPLSSAQVLHPEKYFAGIVPRDVRTNEQAFAAAGWVTNAVTPLGEIGVRGLLLKALKTNEAARAAAGWAGDRAYLFERTGGGNNKGAPLFVWQTAWDKPADAAEFFRAYNALRRRQSDELLSATAGTEEFVWRDTHQRAATLVRISGDSVLIIRGAEADLNAASLNARR